MEKYTKRTWYNVGDPNAIPMSASNLQYMDNGVECSLYKDVGMIAFYCRTVAPDGWLVCDGDEISRINYSDLFAVIGTRFGDGDGSSTFNLPDLRGMFIRGWSGERSGYDSGRSFGSVQEGTEFSNLNGTYIYPDTAEEIRVDTAKYGGGAGYTSPNQQLYRIHPVNIALLPCIYTGVFQNIEF